MGSGADCRVCSGLGRINTSSQIEVKIPPHVDDSTFIDVDLLSMKPDRFTSFTTRNLRIKISVIANGTPG
jgi:DnaJ-class molecular chaperone